MFWHPTLSFHLQANDMVQHIRQAFIDNLETVNWMDSATKEAAKEKVIRATIDS